MDSPLLFALILVTTTFSRAARAQTIQASENPLPVGSNVTLHSSEKVTSGVWMFDNHVIVFISLPGNSIISPIWKDRVTFDSNLSALTIHSVQVNNSGLYTLQAMDSFCAQLTLSVQVPISNVTLMANATNLVEFNDTAVLTCSVLKGSHLSYVWLNGSSVVTASGGVQLSNGGATLTMSVTRYDEGPYKCNVSNGVSQGISLPVHLNISYGPSNIMMMMMPMRSTYITGSNITLECSAESRPPASIHWMVDGVYLNRSGPQLQLERVTESNSGNYQCVFHNTVTSRFSSKSAMISIMKPIAAVVVNYTGGPVMLHESFSLQCEVNGSVSSILWKRNGQLITADNRTCFDMYNKTLTITNVQHSDKGDYQCQAFNAVSNMTSSPYTVEVNYGPMEPVIVGKSMGLIGTVETLHCSSDSNPPSRISWYYNGSVVANTSYIRIGPLTLNMSGTYKCMAFNNITGKNSTAYTNFTVFESLHAQVETPMYPAIEGHFYSLTCIVTGPAEHVFWIKNYEPLLEENTTVLSFHPLKNNDTGHYQCIAINTLWNTTSTPYHLLVNFGPETPMIDGPAFAEIGQYAVFNCSAMSVPPSQFSWWFNGSKVGNSSMYTTDMLTLNKSGEITCEAYNNVTGKNVTKSKMLTVIEAISSVMTRNKTVPINSENFTLTCDVTGPYDMIYWMKDNMQLNMTRPIAGPNNMLHFTPLTLHNDGTYQCMATNRAGQHESPKYMLMVNYGPLSVNISGPDSLKANLDVSLTCSADSRPDCDFYWFFNKSSQALKQGSVITFKSTKENEGNYICKATNPVTNITMYQTKAYTVAAHASTLRFSSQSGLIMMGLFACAVQLIQSLA